MPLGQTLKLIFRPTRDGRDVEPVCYARRHIKRTRLKFQSSADPEPFIMNEMAVLML